MADSDIDENDIKQLQNIAAKYVQVKKIIQENNRTPLETVTKLQQIIKKRAKQIESQSELEIPKTQSKSISRRFIFQKPPSTSSLSYAETLERENQLLKQRILQHSQGQNYESQKITLENKKLLIKVENLEAENKRLKFQFEKCFLELKEMRQKQEDEEKMAWQKEALSDKNPYLMEQFRKKLDEKDKEIKRLSKSLKRFTIVEKKLWVKEKAFEVERSEYLDRILYLSGRLGLTKVDN